MHVKISLILKKQALFSRKKNILQILKGSKIFYLLLELKTFFLNNCPFLTWLLYRYKLVIQLGTGLRTFAHHLHFCISQIVPKNFIKISLIIKECPEEIFIKLAIVLKISKSSWNTVLQPIFRCPYDWQIKDMLLCLIQNVLSVIFLQTHAFFSLTSQILL